jgi:hypothetical protein
MEEGKLSRILSLAFDAKIDSINKKLKQIDMKHKAIDISLENLRSIDTELRTYFERVKALEENNSQRIRNLEKVNDRVPSSSSSSSSYPIPSKSPSESALYEKLQKSPGLSSSRASSSARGLYAIMPTKASRNRSESTPPSKRPSKSSQSQSWKGGKKHRRHTRKHKK